MNDKNVVKSHLSTLLVTLVSLAIAGTLLVIFPAAIDQAAHSHLQSIFNRHAFDLWDNSWYLGRYSFVNYSFAFYFLGYFFGIKLLAVASVGAVILILNKLIDIYLPQTRVVALRWSLLVIPFMVLNGAWPFMLGAAFLFTGLLMRAKGRKHLFAFFSILTWLSSPLALLALIIVIFAAEIPINHVKNVRAFIGVVKAAIMNPFVIPVVILGVLQLLEMRAFPDHGVYPYWWTDLLGVEVFGVVCLFLVRGKSDVATKLRVLIIVYAVANLVAFVIDSNLGANAARIQDLALPILVALVIFSRLRPRWIVGVILIFGAIWNFMPISLLASSGISRTSTPKFWLQLQPELARYVRSGSRVELVDTVNHQGDYYLPKMGFDIVRGWFRQDDFPQNRILYHSRLNAKSYVAWLQKSGASVVVLPPGPYDFSSNNEASLLKSGKTGLKVLAKVGGSELFAVPRSPTIVQSQSGDYLPAKVGLNSIQFDPTKTGTYSLSLYYSPYFQVSTGSICRQSNGMTAWKISHVGPSKLQFDLSLSKMAEVIVNGIGNSCGSHIATG